MVLGGFIGLLISLAFAAVQGGHWPGIILRGCLAALLGGIVFRWWASVWAKGWRESLQEQRKGKAEPARNASTVDQARV